MKLVDPVDESKRRLCNLNVKQQFQRASAFIIVYSVESAGYMQQCACWIEQVDELGPEGVPLLLFANQADKSVENETVAFMCSLDSLHSHLVSHVRQKLRDPSRLILWASGSAKSGQGLQKLLPEMIDRIVEHNLLTKPKCVYQESQSFSSLSLGSTPPKNANPSIVLKKANTLTNLSRDSGESGGGNCSIF